MGLKKDQDQDAEVTFKGKKMLRKLKIKKNVGAMPVLDRIWSMFLLFSFSIKVKK